MKCWLALWFAVTLLGQAGDVAMPQPPALPQITRDVFPGEGWAPGKRSLRGQAVIFNSWEAKRRRIAALEAGATIVMLTGLSEVSKPDLIEVTSPVENLGLEPGDKILRYTERGEGNADFWAKGRWHVDADLGFVANADGSGCQRQCKARVLATGRKKWWLQIRLTDGRAGWTDALNSFNPNF